MSDLMSEILSKINRNDPLFVDILLKRAEFSPDKNAFTFLTNVNAHKLSYKELDTRVRRLAAQLQQMNMQGERALLLYPPGFDYIIGYFACLYAGVIAVPVYPPESGRMENTLPRLELIAKDCEARVALTTDDILNEVFIWRDAIHNGGEIGLIKDTRLANVLNNADKFKDLLSLKWIATDNFEDEIEDQWRYPQLTSLDTAYLQYTSGSTGEPKGVIISHENLMHNTEVISNGFGLNEDHHEGVFWLPIYHDMGLIGGILQPIYSGIHTHLMSPMDFLKRPLKWLQIISDIPKEYKVASGGPNFAYELCARATTPQKSEKLDLSSWVIAFSGSEPVRAETLKKFSEAFAVSKFSYKSFFPCYGLAEATLYVSGADRNEEPRLITVDKDSIKKNVIKYVDQNDPNKVDFVSTGKSILDGIIRIVNPDSQTTCKENEIGEIWFFSRSNSKGYWRKKELTEEIFNAYISDTNEGPFLRTGDLGFISGGELFITGRLKDLIIIRGSNHYPQDIEETVENCSKLLRPTSNAAFSIERDNEEHLVIVQEARPKKDIDWSGIIDNIRAAILERHNIVVSQVVLIQPKTILKTSSGKIRRRDIKKAFHNNDLQILFEWNNFGDLNNKAKAEDQIITSDVRENKLVDKNTEEIIQLIKAKLSDELKINQADIDVNKPFVSFGLDSAKSLKLVADLEDKVNKELEATLLWTYPTINKLSAYLSGLNLVQLKHENSDNEDDFTKKVEQLSDEEAEKLLMKKLGINNES